VTIGSDIAPIEGALLDLKQNAPDSENATAKKGFVLPRVALTAKNSLAPLVTAASDLDKKNHTGVTVYNVREIAATNEFSVVKEGLNVWDGKQWVTVGKQSPRFFYMPTFDLTLGNVGEVKTFDIYGEYSRQFCPQPANTKYHSSKGDNVLFPGKYSKYELEYAVLDYDPNLVTVTSINSEGVMSYKTNSTAPSPHSYITVVCIVKE